MRTDKKQQGLDVDLRAEKNECSMAILYFVRSVNIINTSREASVAPFMLRGLPDTAVAPCHLEGVPLDDWCCAVIVKSQASSFA